MRCLHAAFLSLALLLVALPLFAKTALPTDRPELRAFWVDGFNDGFKTPAQCDLLLHRLRVMRCNAVFVQMRKRADAYYLSHYEEWAKDDAGQFDALQYLCDKGHERGKPRIQIHAWINACAIGGNPSAGALAKVHPEWLSLSDTGADFDTEATKIDPGNPQAAEWTFRVYMDVVRHYDVDGIHLDFIRYGGNGKTVGHWGYNPVSVARFNARYGTSGQPVWNDPRWQAWRRAQVTALVRRVYVNAVALKPKIVVSAATICWGDAPADDAAYNAKSAAYTEVFAPWRDWMREGILDLNCPMTYFSRARSEAKWAGWSRFAKDRQFGHQTALGVGAYLNPVADSLALIRQTRLPTAAEHRAAGFVLYCYDTPRGINGQEVEGDTTLFAALPQKGVLERDVPPPPMLWKTRPATGAILGMLLTGDALTPADGTEITAVRVDGRVHQAATCDGSGSFAFAHLPPGSYNVTARLPGLTQKLYAQVRPGRTAHLTVVLPDQSLSNHSLSNQSISLRRVTGIGEQLDGARVVLGAVWVTSGSDKLGDHFFVADGFGQPAIRVESPGLVPPVIMGDKVVVSGMLHHTPGGIVLTANVARLVGMEIVRP